MSRRDFLATCVATLFAPIAAPTIAGEVTRLATSSHSGINAVQLDTKRLQYIADEPSLGRIPLWVVLDSGCDVCLEAFSDLRTRAAIHDRALSSFEVRFVPVGDTPESAAASTRAFAAGSMEGFFVKNWTAAITQVAIQAQQQNTDATRALPGYPAFLAEGHPIKLGYGGWADFADWLGA